MAVTGQEGLQKQDKVPLKLRSGAARVRGSGMRKENPRSATK